MGYAIAHPRLNLLGILPLGSRPSDVHSHDGIIMGRVSPVGAYRIRPASPQGYHGVAGGIVIRVLYGRYFGGGVVAVGER